MNKMVQASLIFLMLFPACCKTADKNEVPEEMKDTLPCMFSSLNLNSILEEQGYGKNVITYTGGPLVWFVHDSIVFCDRTRRAPVYVLQKNGKIKVLPGIKKETVDYYFNENLELVSLQSPDLGSEWDRNYEPCFDKNTKYIGYNYIENSRERKDWKDKDNKYLVTDIKTGKIIYEGGGRIYNIQIDKERLYFLTSETVNNSFKIKLNYLNTDNNNIYSEEIKEPEKISDSMIFSYYDIDAEHGLMACAAYAFPGRFFFQKSLRTKVWIYDIHKKEYVYSWYPNRKEGGHIQVMFLPDSLRKLLCSD